MNVIDRIKDNFNKGFFGKSMLINELPVAYPAWTLKQSGWVGVAVPIDAYVPFNEKYNHMKISTEHDVVIGDREYDILMITSDNMDTRNEFATVCADFVDPGKDGTGRANLISNPAGWWKRWRDLLGNVSTEKAPYDVLGELLMVKRLAANGKNPHWKGIDHSTHDVETADFTVEVKSTTARYGYEITASSVYQMKPVGGKPLYLAFTRFEASDLGTSIDDVVESMKAYGYDMNKIEEALSKSGLEKGCIARTQKYKLIEWKKYTVDDMFPCITESSFKNDCIPQNIIRFTYTIDLSGLDGENLL